MNGRAHRIHDAKRTNDSTTVWTLITAAFEEAAIDYLGIQGAEKKADRGRGHIEMKNVTDRPVVNPMEPPKSETSELERRAIR